MLFSKKKINKTEQFGKIIIDDNKKLFKIGSKIHSYDDLLSFELIEDGNIIAKRESIALNDSPKNKFFNLLDSDNFITKNNKQKEYCSDLQFIYSVKNEKKSVNKIVLLALKTNKSKLTYINTINLAREIIIGFNYIINNVEKNEMSYQLSTINEFNLEINDYQNKIDDLQSQIYDLTNKKEALLKEVNKLDSEKFILTNKNFPVKKTSHTKNISYTKARKHTDDFTVIDFETTGLSSTSDEIIQVAAIKYRNNIVTDSIDILVKPTHKKISKRITEITGITNEDVINSPTIDIVIPALLSFINGETLVAHNASFDMKFLIENIQKNNIEVPKFRVIDTLSLSRKHIEDTENHKLETLKDYLDLDYNSHNALDDCRTTGELYIYIKKYRLLMF